MLEADEHQQKFSPSQSKYFDLTFSYNNLWLVLPRPQSWAESFKDPLRWKVFFEMFLKHFSDEEGKLKTAFLCFLI